MGQELTLPASFGTPPKAFAGQKGANDELGAGVASSYGIVGYKGKVWSIKFGGNETKLMREDGDGARGSIEVVIVKAAAPISKIFYEGGYVDGSNTPPDCWSSNGVTPDAGASNKQNATCAACPRNAWGSRITESGKQGKACSDSRRIAVVPLNDMDNEMFGGPMLLRVPAASLKDLKAYGELLNSYQFPYYAAATRISFDPNEAFPKFVFSAMRPLNEAEAAAIMELREDRRVANILSEAQDLAAPRQEVASVPSSPFEQADSAQPSRPSQSGQASATTAAPKAAAKPAPVEDVTGDEEEEGAQPPQMPAVKAPASFEALLDNIL